MGGFYYLFLIMKILPRLNDFYNRFKCFVSFRNGVEKKHDCFPSMDATFSSSMSLQKCKCFISQIVPHFEQFIKQNINY